RPTPLYSSDTYLPAALLLSPLLVSLSPLLSPPSLFFFSLLRPPPRSTLFPYTTLFRSALVAARHDKTGIDMLDVDEAIDRVIVRSEEHTSELQSRFDLVCRLLLEKKKKDKRKYDVTEREQPAHHDRSNHERYILGGLH